MNRFTTISNSQLSALIDEWVKNQRNRKLLKRRFIDGITLDKLSDEYDITVDRIKQIIAKERKELESHIN